MCKAKNPDCKNNDKNKKYNSILVQQKIAEEIPWFYRSVLFRVIDTIVSENCSDVEMYIYIGDRTLYFC